MRFRTVAVAAAFAVGLAGASQAADVTEQGAKDLLGNLTHFLPDDLVKSGFVAVTPASGHYEITYDLQKLFDKLNVTGFDITGLKPLMALATPQDNGLWNIEGNNAVDVTARSKPGSSPDAEFRYAVASSSFTGVFDPAIHYVRSMDVKGNGITLATKTTDSNGVEKNDITIDGINYALASSSSGEPDKLDFQMIGGLQSLHDKIASDSVTLGEFKIGAIDFRANATKLPLKALNEILRFVSDHKDAKNLSDSESAALKALLRNAMPIVGSLEETVSAKDISVTTPLGNGGLQQMGYSFKVAGPANAMNADFGMRAEKLTLASGLVPQDYVAFIPDAAELQMQFPNLNFSALLDVLQQSDFNNPGSTASMDDKLQQAMFPDGTMTINFPKISAVSGLYDIEASGSMRGWLNEKDRVSMTMTVFARDLDKTISAVQDAAKTEPDLNQLSFGLMMAKGFAKTDPDGRSRWDVSIADDESVTINGQAIK